MRLHLILFAAYMIGLALIPCQDGAALSDDCTSTEIHVGDTDHEEQPHEDDCTPFCICVCCGVMRSAPPANSVVFSVPASPPPGLAQPEFVPQWTATLYAESDGQPPRA